MSNYLDSFTKRIKSVSDAQSKIENYWQSKGIKYTMLGFDHRHEVNNFYKLPKSIRSLPDYVVESKDGTPVVCEIKGTNKVKLNGLSEALRFEAECDTAGSKMYFIFLIQDKLYFESPKKLFQKMNNKTIQVFPDNFEPYIEVNLSDLNYIDEIQSVSVV